MTSKTQQNTAHPEYLGWQMDWPLYVKAPLVVVAGRTYSKGDYFPWAESNFEPDKIARMYSQKLLHHDAPRATEEGHGDRLGEMSTGKLHDLVSMLNDNLKKEHCATEAQFKQKRCRKSSIVDTQRRFIRQFLSKNPYMSDYFLSIRDNYISKTGE